MQKVYNLAKRQKDRVFYFVEKHFQGKWGQWQDHPKVKKVKHSIMGLWDEFKRADNDSDIKIWCAAALLYFIVPTDFVFDYLPMVGMVDDVAFIAMVLKKIKRPRGR